jgi:hypothetical protein
MHSVTTIDIKLQVAAECMMHGTKKPEMEVMAGLTHCIMYNFLYYVFSEFQIAERYISKFNGIDLFRKVFFLSWRIRGKNVCSANYFICTERPR